ncbi:MAG: NAD-dependent epimerase/dehydratase family protein [Tepidisphaerales bacterium]
MRILISGAAGFIGSHLVDALLAQGHEVIGVDNFCTGQQANIAHLIGIPKFRLLDHDMVQPVDADGPLDRIYHLASPASPVAYKNMRIATLKVNAAGTWNLLELACHKNARLLVTSTSEINGDPPKEIQREDDWGNVNPIGLRSMYEESKRYAEACAMAYHRERGADTRIVRIFNTYGPRMHPDDGRVVTNFVFAALSNHNLPVVGDGTQSRTFCYVSDTVRGLTSAMEADFHEPINIGNPQETSILELARTVLELVPGTRSRIVFEPRGDYDPRSRCPDTMRAKQILGWSPAVGLKDGLAKVVEYHRTAMRNAE